MSTGGGSSSRQQAAKDVVDVLNEMSTILVRALSRHFSPQLTPPKHTGLDRTTLSLCISLIENGVNPEALAVSISSVLQRAAADEAGRLSSRSLEGRRRPLTSLVWDADWDGKIKELWEFGLFPWIFPRIIAVILFQRAKQASCRPLCRLEVYLGDRENKMLQLHIIKRKSPPKHQTKLRYPSNHIQS